MKTYIFDLSIRIYVMASSKEEALKEIYGEPIDDLTAQNQCELNEVEEFIEETS